MKEMLKDINEEIRQMEQQVKIAELHMKTKDDEVKMQDLKIKELMKQVPGYKLKPISAYGGANERPRQKKKIAANSRERPGENAFLTQMDDDKVQTV